MYEEELWKNHFEYAEKNLDKYLDWSYKEVLPKYEKHIENENLKKKEKNELVGVAGIFLESCGQMGMFELNRLPPEFIADFPEMFEKTVIGPKISKDKITSYLENFLSFLEVFYAIRLITMSK